MSISNNIDRIVSRKLKKAIAVIKINAIKQNEIEYEAIILENNFPEKLLELITSFHKEIDNFSLSIADKIEREIKSYSLYLKSNNTKIFDIKIEGDKIFFYTKYSTKNGYLDDYPQNTG